MSAPPEPDAQPNARDGRDARAQAGTRPESVPPAEPFRVLFVCWGNICRSPTAEGIMRRLVDDAGLAGAIEIDSAGTSDEHAGSRPDRRALTEADVRGLDLRTQRARQVRPDDWDRFDLLLVADGTVERRLLRLAPNAAAEAKVHRMMEFGPDAHVADVPDPYYGGPDGFQHVYDLLERACRGLLDHIRTRLAQPTGTIEPGPTRRT